MRVAMALLVTVCTATPLLTQSVDRGSPPGRLVDIGGRKPHALGDRPLVVLTRGVDSSQELRDVHAGLARLSTNSRHTVVAGSGHEVHLFQPGVVI
jgi:hypothetical protein